VLVSAGAIVGSVVPRALVRGDEVEKMILLGSYAKPAKVGVEDLIGKNWF